MARGASRNEFLKKLGTERDDLHAKAVYTARGALKGEKDEQNRIDVGNGNVVLDRANGEHKLHDISLECGA